MKNDVIPTIMTVFYKTLVNLRDSYPQTVKLCLSVMKPYLGIIFLLIPQSF